MGRKTLLVACLLMCCTAWMQAQDRPAYMQPKQFNLSYFFPDVRVDMEQHPELFPDSLLGHPDMGILPHNTPCYDCVEEIGKRTAYGRYFVDVDSKAEFYVQSSYFPIHYKDENGFVVSIDPRLKPTADPNMLEAAKQPIPTNYNMQSGAAGIKTNATWFRHNEELSMGIVGSSAANARRNRQTIGSNGTYISNAWPNVDIQQIFEAGSIETDYILKINPGLQTGEWLYFADAIELPAGWSVHPVDGAYTTEGYWAGAIELKDDKGNTRIRYKRPAYYDGYGYGGPGFYKLVASTAGAPAEIHTLVPASMLNDPQVQYPFYIDPIVEGEDSLGNYASGFGPGNNGANMAFSTSPQTCNYSLAVTVPGMSEIVETYFGVEYENTFSPTCGNPPLPAPYCTFNDVRMEIVSLECGSRTGQLTCDPASPPFIGTCTTDSNLVTIAREILYANFLDCIPPQCPDYELNFRLENRELQCGETCGYNCASGHMFMVTIKARTIENVATISRDTICAGDTVTLTAFPDWGVPPYTYEWTPGGFTDSQVVTTAEIPTIFTVIARDVCGNEAVPQDVFVLINDAPTADAGEDQTLCEGEAPGGLGGSPTTTAISPTYQWTATPAFASSWIDNPTGANPNFLVPADSTGVFQLIVRVDDPLCYRRDTVLVTIVEEPNPSIVPDSAIVICAGEPTTISLDTTFASYNWSNGETGSSITVSAAGTYDVTVTDDNGCTGVSNTATATEKPLLEFDVFADPDSSINLGESTSLGATVDLDGPDVEIYAWSPDVNITCLNCATPIVSPEEDQYYVLQLTSDGCVVRDSILINVVYPNAYWIPSAFSPDKNGFNDQFFIIKESGVTVELFQVFNRWGEKVHDATLPWDGTYKGDLQDLDVFTYIFKLRLADGSEVIESGNVTLVK